MQEKGEGPAGGQEKVAEGIGSRGGAAAVTKLSVGEKIGYGFGDGAANFVFQTMLIFQLPFYTNVFGISAAAAGTLLLVGRFWDAVFDPFMGTLADRTNTRWGKFRPWVLWSAVPFAVAFVLVFTTPHLGATGKMVYAYIMYILLMTLYSVNNTPYSALNGVITGDVNERTSLSSYRFFFSMTAALIVQGFTLPMVYKFGQGDSQKGYTMTIGMFAIVMIIFYIITFFSVRERVKPDPKQKSSPKKDLVGLLKTRPWVAMFVTTLFVFVTLAMWGSGMFYYFTYYIDKDALYNFLQSLGLSQSASGTGGVWYGILNGFGLIVGKDGSNVSGVGFSLFNMAGMLMNILGLMVSPALARRFGKKLVFGTGLFFTALFTGLFILLPAQAVGAAFILNILKSAAYGPTIPLLWAMMADVADYSEWRTRRRATGLVFAGISFALKAGLGFGGAICGWILSAYGYNNLPNAVQTPHAILGIRMASSIFPALTFFAGFTAILFYAISKKLSLQIQDELAERRKSFEY
jgi:Na+/melibiose symporter-like transporter